MLILYAAFVFMFDADPSKVRWIYVAYGLLCGGILLLSWWIRFYRESAFLIGYFLFGVVSLFWAEDFSQALEKLRAVFFLIIFLILATSYLVKIQKPVYLMVALLFGALALSFYMFFLYGPSELINSVWEGSERLGNLVNNVNALANNLVVGMVILIGVSVFYRKWFLLIFVIPISICLMAAGSRTATISLLVGVLVLILLWIRSTGRFLKGIFYLILSIGIIVAVWLIIRNIPAFQQIVLKIENSFAILMGKETFVKENSTKMRMDLIEFGWNQFLESPIWGNGIGCAGLAIPESYGHVTYLHTNYVEILASGGIIGFILYYIPYVVLLITFIKRIFRQNDNSPLLLVSAALLVTRLVGQIGIVTYYSKVEYMLLALWISVVNIKGKNNEKRIERKI